MDEQGNAPDILQCLELLSAHVRSHSELGYQRQPRSKEQAQQDSKNESDLSTQTADIQLNGYESRALDSETHYKQQPAPPRVLPATIAQLPSTPLPSHPSPSTASLLNHITSTILHSLPLSSLSPNYYGFVTGGATPASLLADMLASIHDQNVSVHLPHQSIATTVEVVTLNMLLDLFHLPRQTWGIGRQPTSTPASSGGGILTTGATASNILGLALGREYVLSRRLSRRRNGMAMSTGQHGLFATMAAAGVSKLHVLTTMPHSSIAKAASVVGIGRVNVVSVGSGLEIDLARLESLASEDGAASILAVSCGEVNTGRFATSGLAQMRKLREICDKHGVWMHVDGAFGMFGRLLMDSADRGRYEGIVRGCEGLELADSITGDAHKILNVPYDCGFFFHRHKGLAEEVFQNGNAAYLSSEVEQSGDGVSGPLNVGIENSRRFRALPVYATLLAYGREGYVEMVKRLVGLARRVAGWIWESDGFELLPSGGGKEEMVERTFMVVLFRAKVEEANQTLVERINATGKIYVTGTVWDGKPAARIAVSNWQADVERDGRLIEEVLGSVLKE